MNDGNSEVLFACLLRANWYNKWIKWSPKVTNSNEKVLQDLNPRRPKWTIKSFRYSPLWGVELLCKGSMVNYDKKSCIRRTRDLYLLERNSVLIQFITHLLTVIHRITFAYLLDSWILDIVCLRWCFVMKHLSTRMQHNHCCRAL